MIDTTQKILNYFNRCAKNIILTPENSVLIIKKIQAQINKINSNQRIEL